MNSLLFLKTLSTRTAKIFLGIHHTQSFLKRKDNNKKKKILDYRQPTCCRWYRPCLPRLYLIPIWMSSISFFLCPFLVEHEKVSCWPSSIVGCTHSLMDEDSRAPMSPLTKMLWRQRAACPPVLLYFVFLVIFFLSFLFGDKSPPTGRLWHNYFAVPTNVPSPCLSFSCSSSLAGGNDVQTPGVVRCI